MFKKRGFKKAQITIFVILGLIILIIGAFLIFFFNKKSGDLGEFKEEAVPDEFKPVQDYVQNCIHKTGIDALKRMGSSGGFLPYSYALSSSNILINNADPTSSEFVSLTGDSDMIVPYYVFVPRKSSFSNYEYSSAAPTIESMESQLDNFVSNNIGNCINEFYELEKNGYDISSADNIQTESQIKDETVEFYVTYELNVSKDNIRTRMKNFKSVVRFPYKKYYDLAMTIMQTEIETQFLESFTTQLINQYAGLDANKLPPFVDYSNQPYIMTWSNAKVNEDLNSLLLSYVPALQVVDSKNYQKIDASGQDAESYFFRSLSMDIFNKSIIENTSITFFYRDRTVKSKVQPSNGDMIKPKVNVQEGNNFIPKSQFNAYNFFYDVSYPIFVEIRGYDNNVEIPEFSFVFALEENLIENKPPLAWMLGLGTKDWDYSNINRTVTISPDAMISDEGKPLSVKPLTFSKSLFCDETTWNSGIITVRVADANTNNPLEGATVTYSCGDHATCWAGSVELVNGVAEWEGKLPLCTGGTLTVSKEGFGSKSAILTTEEGNDVILETQRLNELKELTATVKKLELQASIVRDENLEWTMGPESTRLLDINPATEQVIVTISQRDLDSGANPVVNTILFGKDGEVERDIKLAPGKYEVTASFMDSTGLNIPANCSGVCTSKIIVCLSYQYYPETNVDINPAPWGGLKIDEDTGLFEIKAGELYASDKIEFRVLKLPDLRLTTPPGGCIEHLDLINNISDYSRKYHQDLLPILT